eukprot:NODE_4410_length_793_cov_14.124625_g4251_i0.p1 GENE.NODE_4410_length_793_cov_14.124625_g4251_i0~~NODE_4410_length_793_cov_14.124625_g4251_i0.p1  ORF type:complete len:212 (-),score=46.90 NODE_4410_length_793_cov_14.124625_g4251_i0:134-769(-)
MPHDFRLNDSSTSDLRFVVDGQEFFVHKMVLRRAPYLAEFLGKDPHCTRIVVSNASSAAFQTILETLYGAAIENAVPPDCDPRFIQLVWEVSIRFGLEAIVRYTSDLLLECLNDEIVCSILLTIRKYPQVSAAISMCNALLQAQCLEYVATHEDQLLEMPDYRLLKTESATLSRAIAEKKTKGNTKKDCSTAQSNCCWNPTHCFKAQSNCC